MIKLKKMLLGLCAFILVYYLVYLLLFSIKDKQGIPIIAKLQEKLILSPDIFGKATREYDFNTRYDYVFLGSSHTYREFDPRIFESFGLKTYNLGSSSQTPLNSYFILKNYCSKNVEHVVFEVYPIVANLSGLENYFDQVASVDNYKMLAEMGFELNSMRALNVLSIKPLIEDYNKNVECNIKTCYQGYVENCDTAEANITYTPLKLEADKVSHQIKYVKKIISFCKSKNIGLTFVYAPLPSELAIENEELYIDQVKQLASSNGLKFLNYSRNHSLNSRYHFYDDDHLNKAGVEIFNRTLVKEFLH